MTTKIYPNALKKGDKVAIVSLSFGALGEPSCRHSLAIGKQNLKNLGLDPVFMPNALKGIDFIKSSPQARAEDLKAAFYDDDIRAIICAIGGNDGYLLAPYLLGDNAFVKYVKTHPKIFMGFSDSTLHHLMLYKMGLATFYGQAFLTDLAEVGYSNIGQINGQKMGDGKLSDNKLGDIQADMLPFSKAQFAHLFGVSAPFELPQSPVWYDERATHDISQVGIARRQHQEKHGVEVLYKDKAKVEGQLLGGCVQSLYNILTGERFAEQKRICDAWQLFPPPDEWRGKVLFLETSEACTHPDELDKMLKVITKRLGVIRGVIIGKPQNNVYYDEYKAVYKKAFDGIPTLYNLNFGHAYPRLILPYGAKVLMDMAAGKVWVMSEVFDGG